MLQPLTQYLYIERERVYKKYARQKPNDNPMALLIWSFSPKSLHLFDTIFAIEISTEIRIPQEKKLLSSRYPYVTKNTKFFLYMAFYRPLSTPSYLYTVQKGTAFFLFSSTGFIKFLFPSAREFQNFFFSETYISQMFWLKSLGSPVVKL